MTPRGGQISTGKIPITEPRVSCVKIGVQTGGVSCAKIGVQTWEFVKIYSDEGITGTNIKRRVGFRTMIQDAVDGRIDLIITKSISRFARNTLDSISYVRQLKSAGTEVYFEKENLWSFDSKSEMVLSMLSAIAQEESRSISENVKIGKRWAMKEGKVMIPCKNFLGYQNIEGEIKIENNEAAIVRRIYSMFLKDGLTRKAIADTLKDEGVPTPSKKGCNWTVNNITSILTNEKYKLNKIAVLEAFVREIESKENAISEFSTDLWNLLIQQAIAHKDKTISFIFKNGTEVRQ